jgi:hypothetical protein
MRGKSRQATQFSVPKESISARPCLALVPLKPATLVTLTPHNTDGNLFHKQTTLTKHEHNNSLHRWMRLRRDPLRIHSQTGSDASLSLSRLPASEWRAVFVFRHRACGAVQALARLAPLSCVAQRTGWHDSPRLLPRMRRAGCGQVRCRSSICGDQNREPGWSELVQTADGRVDM